MKKILTLIGLAATLTLSAPVAMADLSTCIDAAIRGPGREFQKVYGHDFHCKPVQSVSLGADARKIVGWLSHQITLRPDDEVYYEFVIRNGRLSELKTTVHPGGLSGLIGVAATVIAAYYNVPISPETAEKVSRKLAGQVTGRGWDDAAEAIVSTIALKMASESHAAPH
jgi:hypothetical protein